MHSPNFDHISKKQENMFAEFATSNDGTRIAYEITGSGPAVVLLHGGAQSRQTWRAAGYLDRLSPNFTVLTMDLRGHGDSDKPARVEAYGIERHCQDILSVVDHAGIERFSLWGYSFGANVGRYLAAESERVARFVMVGVPFGPGASGDFRRMVMGVRDRWIPILRAQSEGTLDLDSLTHPECAYLQSSRAQHEVPWLTAILDWREIVPAQLRCPTLWILGEENSVALENARSIGSALTNSKVSLCTIDGLTHEMEMSDIDNVLPRVEEFIRNTPE
ncbi:alpha/beta hydrolase [Bradyrhizobium sp. INPA03-11B]|uniref:alpha/beta fold hydrolase n=1 Tax=Bradyrhizobium sp. INPA03-11B TaxID=418598 RepID=UPI00338FADD2